MEKGDIAAAVEAFKQSGSLAPHFKTFECIGECLLAQNDHAQAALYLAAAVGMGRNNRARPLYLLARALVELDNVELAREKLTQALDLNPSYRSARKLLETLE